MGLSKIDCCLLFISLLLFPYIVVLSIPVIGAYLFYEFIIVEKCKCKRTCCDRIDECCPCCSDFLSNVGTVIGDISSPTLDCFEKTIDCCNWRIFKANHKELTKCLDDILIYIIFHKFIMVEIDSHKHSILDFFGYFYTEKNSENRRVFLLFKHFKVNNIYDYKKSTHGKFYLPNKTKTIISRPYERLDYERYRKFIKKLKISNIGVLRVTSDLNLFSDNQAGRIKTFGVNILGINTSSKTKLMECISKMNKLVAFHFEIDNSFETKETKDIFSKLKFVNLKRVNIKNTSRSMELCNLVFEFVKRHPKLQLVKIGFSVYKGIAVNNDILENILSLRYGVIKCLTIRGLMFKDEKEVFSLFPEVDPWKKIRLVFVIIDSYTDEGEKCKNIMKKARKKILKDYNKEHNTKVVMKVNEWGNNSILVDYD